MILAAREAGGGRRFCLLHGLFGAARNFGALQRRFAAQFRVIALDPAQPWREPARARHELWDDGGGRGETLAAMDARPAMILGHSMGGKVTMRLALERAEEVRALVAADIAPVPYPPHHREMAAAMLALPLTPGLTRQARMLRSPPRSRSRRCAAFCCKI